MYNNYSSIKEHKMGIKLAVALWTFLDGLGITMAGILFLNLQPVEQALLFVATISLLGYRIYHLHLDAERKRLENEDKKIDIENKRRPKS